jgi:hypothetical protein
MKKKKKTVFSCGEAYHQGHPVKLFSKKCTPYSGSRSELSDPEYPGYHRLRLKPPNKLYSLHVVNELDNY